MDANKLVIKIFEKGLNVEMATEVYRNICISDQITIGDAMKLKELLGLTNLEAAEIFLS